MKRLFTLMMLCSASLSALGQGTVFTYQGFLTDRGAAANGGYDLQFTLYDSTNLPGTIVAGPITNTATLVSNGLFAVSLDFGLNAFTGAPRWLDIAMRTNGAGPFTGMGPRQRVSAAPYAMTARDVTGNVAASQLIGTIQPGNIGAGTITSLMLADASIHSNHLAVGSVHSNALIAGSVTALALANDSVHSNHLASGSVHSNALIAGSVNALALANDSVHSNHLAVGSVHSNALIAGSVTALALANDSIHSNHLAVGSVHSNAFLAGSVTALALANASIHSNHLAVGSVHSNALIAGSVTALALANDSVHSNHLASGSVHSNALIAGSVNALALANDSVHSNHLAVGSVHSNALIAGSVTALALANDSIHSNHLAVGSIHSNAFLAGSVTALALANNSILSNHLAVGSVHSNAFIVGSVTALALANDSIHSNHLAVGSVHSNAFLAGSVTALALANDSVHSNHLAIGSVHSNALIAASVTALALANDSVHSNHLAAGSVHSNAFIPGSILAFALANNSIHSNHLDVGSVHSDALVVGSVTASALADGSIHSNHLASASVHSNALAIGSVTALALANDSVHSNHLAIGSVHSNALALGSVTATALADGTIHSNHLASGSVDATALAAGSVTASSLADGAVSLNKLVTAPGIFAPPTTIVSPNSALFYNFGVSVAASGNDKLLIGAYNDSSVMDNAGAAYLLSTNGTGIRLAKPGAITQDRFGFAVAGVGPDKVLIGADGDDTGALDAGAAFLFSTNGTLLTTFTNPTPAASDFFGYSAAAVGSDKVLIGAYADHFGANLGGAAYLFTTNRILITTITNPTPATNDRFGIAVAAVGSDKVLIGADLDDSGATDAGIAYLFSTNGTLLTTFTNPTPATSDAFGSALAAVGTDKVLIGAYGDNSGVNTGGAAYLYSTAGTLLNTFTNPTPAAGDKFGVAVAAVGLDKVLIGASSDNTAANDAGSAYLFSTTGALLSTLNNPFPAAGDAFGNAVAVVGSDKLLIGAVSDDISGNPDTGAAYLFTIGSYIPGLTPDPSVAPWLKSGANIQFTGGNVGIGTANPTNKLHVVGGATFGTGSASANQNVVWAPGSASWSFTSDRNSKDHIVSVNGLEVLDKLCHLSIAEWSYIGHDQRHIGPMAQDFHAQFPLNRDDKSLNDADLHGVALAAIQGLNQKLESENTKLRQENAGLKARLDKLESLIDQRR